MRIKLVCIHEIVISEDRRTKIGMSKATKGTICETNLKDFEEYIFGRCLTSYIPIYINNISIGGYRRDRFITLSEWREQKINEILHD